MYSISWRTIVASNIRGNYGPAILERGRRPLPPSPALRASRDAGDKESFVKSARRGFGLRSKPTVYAVTPYPRPPPHPACHTARHPLPKGEGKTRASYSRRKALNTDEGEGGKSGGESRAPAFTATQPRMRRAVLCPARRGSCRRYISASRFWRSPGGGIG